MTAWIKMIPEEEATGDLREMYAQAMTPHGTVDNVMKVHSLRPHTMQGHMALYKSVLHHPDITLPLWFLEVVASYTSIKNLCDYSLSHHFANARRLISNEKRANLILAALKSGKPQTQFQGKELALLHYTEKLTTQVSEMNIADIKSLHDAGCTDGEILEVNQVVAYFNYSNRVLNGLGVTTEGDAIGYYD
ncbi:MAG: alkylhydroperoxidase [SAR86 cluster bacterium]|uniref:Alkylhydroperoxidase n=1 Tax=SAR86 cluster bacterium TaxID=2030880 RepID=A0A2A5C986_9GAMM|nr:MAG: alkylhydroperoxidase [SAR86 cluster bacterium]